MYLIGSLMCDRIVGTSSSLVRQAFAMAEVSTHRGQKQNIAKRRGRVWEVQPAGVQANPKVHPKSQSSLLPGPRRYPQPGLLVTSTAHRSRPDDPHT